LRPKHNSANGSKMSSLFIETTPKALRLANSLGFPHKLQTLVISSLSYTEASS
jgi:hypothetical protein